MGCTDDVLEIQPLRAHASKFEDGRYWRVESHVTLMRIDAATDLMIFSPIAKSLEALAPWSD